MALFGKKKQNKVFKYPGKRQLANGYTAVILCERESSDAAGAYLSTLNSKMSTTWNQEIKQGHLNISNKPLISVHAGDTQSAASITAGLSLSGLRATYFSSSEQSLASMHESLYAAVGKRLPFVLNISCQSVTKATANIHCSHDDYHSIDDTGFIQLFAHNNQAAADLNLIGRKIAELSLNPVAVAQDGFFTSELIESVNVPERELIEEFVGFADDIIATPTPAQKILYGKSRRRIPETWNMDLPSQTGGIQASDSYMSTVAGQRPYFFEHVTEITEQCMNEWYELTGRRYQRITQTLCDDADYLIIAQGSVINQLQLAAEYLREQRQLKVGIVHITLFRPFPGDLISQLLKAKQAVLVLERCDQPLAENLPIITDIRSCISKALDNGKNKQQSFPGYASYHNTTDIPDLYSASYGLGGHPIQSSDIIAAVDNMLPTGKQLKFFYLGINFVHNKFLSPQQELQYQSIIEAYPEISKLALKSNESVTLIPKNARSIRIHSCSEKRSAAIGQKLANCLFEKFGLDVKANPENQIEKKGQPNTFYVTASNETLSSNPDYNRIHVVIATDQNVFSYCDPLTGLVDEGIFIVQSTLEDATQLWRSFPASAQKIIHDKHIKIYYVNARHIAKQISDDYKQQAELQNSVLKAVLFKASEIASFSTLTEEQILTAIDDHTELVQNSHDNLQTLITTDMSIGDTLTSEQQKVSPPLLLQHKPENDNAIADIHRFWNQTANLYVEGKNDDSFIDPFMALGVVPASTAVFGDMTPNRQQHPLWKPENCTACGNCYNACPDSAIAGLVNTVNEVFESNIKRIEKTGRNVKHLRRAIRTVEKKYHALTADKSVGTTLSPLFAKSIGDTIKEYAEPERAEVAQEFEWFKEVTGSFKFALTEPYHDEMNSRMPRNGGLFSITIDPNSCKGCMECVTVCETEALTVVEQTTESVQHLRNNWEYWLDLPTSNKKYSRIDDLQAKNGVLNTLLLDKKNHLSMLNSDNSQAGSGEKTAIHLFTSTVTALMQPRVEQHIKKIDTLISDMEKHIRLKLVETLDISDIDALETAIDENQNVDLTLSRLSGSLDQDKPTQPINPKWLRWALQLVNKLKYLKWCYRQGMSGEGRASMMLTESSFKAAPRRATFPYNPYPFPWSAHLSQDAPALAMGLFEGHMAKMAEGFKTIRMAELEIKGKYQKTEHDDFFTYFDWRQFSEEEYFLCPPVVTVEGDGISFESGLQNVSRSLMSGMPLKILLLDNQPLSGEDKLRKELGLITMAHRTAYVQQGSIANTQHLLSGFIDGLNYRGPALWSIYGAKQPENGLAKNSLVFQSKLALESRAYPLMTFDPRLGESWEQCISLAGNPQLDQDWIIYTLAYTDEYGNQFDMDVPLTYADWALTEAQFSHHFKAVAADDAPANMVLLTDYLEMDKADQADHIAFIWAVDPQSNHLLKVAVSSKMVEATQERKAFWHTLKGLSGNNRVEVDIQAIADQARHEMAQTITEGLMSMVGGDAGALSRILADVPAPQTNATPLPVAKPTPPATQKAEEKTTNKSEAESITEPSKNKADKKPTAGNISLENYEPVWIDTPDCTTCDECVEIAPSIFQYNAEKKAIVVDPTKGTYADIVRSAEKCTAVIIHPGTPWNPDEPNLDKLIKRAEKFQ